MKTQYLHIVSFLELSVNYVFPRPDVKRPMPNEDDNLEAAILNEATSEDLIDAKICSRKNK